MRNTKFLKLVPATIFALGLQGCGGDGGDNDAPVFADDGSQKASAQAIAMTADQTLLAITNSSALNSRLVTWGYLASWPDLMAGYGTNLDAAESHRLGQGVFERRQAETPPFDFEEYLTSNPDVAALCPDGAATDSRECAARQFVTSGFSAGRNWTDLMALTYVASYEDLSHVLGDDPSAAIAHYRSFGISEGRRVTWNSVGWGKIEYPYMADLFDNDYTGITRYAINNNGVPATPTTRFLLTDNHGSCITPNNWDVNTVGNSVITWSCPNYWGQRWQVNVLTGQIFNNQNPSNCLAMTSISAGGLLQLATCDSSDERQQWILTKGNRIQALQPGDVDDDDVDNTTFCAGGNASPGLPIPLAQCSETDTEQNWKLIAVP